MEFLHFKWKVE